MNDNGNKTNSKSEDKPIVIRNTTDLQRLKLEKLMKNPDKPVVIPERPKGRSMPSVPDFVRNVMGSSAGAGSGEFHVYRHLRRKEYARQKFIQEKSEKEKLNDEYHLKIETNRLASEEKTAKKRAKRLKKKIKAKQRAKKPKLEKESSQSSDNDSSEKSDAEEKTDEPVTENTVPENIQNTDTESTDKQDSCAEMKDSNEAKTEDNIKETVGTEKETVPNQEINKTDENNSPE